MDYNSVQDIISAGISNMQCLRNNKKNDDGTDTLVGVDWFSFKGVVSQNIYVHGNSQLGFGTSSYHLKVNNRDGAVYSIYREEGTLLNYYRFLKIRWSGYSYYGSTTSTYAIEYDVILWDTGDISLHMVKIPTSYNTGTYSLTEFSTYTYTVSNSSPDVTFKKTDNGYEVINSIISLELPYEQRYLIRQGSDLYSVANNILTKLDTNVLSASVFLSSGVKEAKDLIIMAISNLSNPELLYWTDKDMAVSNLVIEANPELPQIALTKEETIPNEKSIAKAEIVASNDMKFSISFNDGANWWYLSEGVWLESKSVQEGMPANLVGTISSSIWSNIVSSNKYRFRCVFTTINSKLEVIGVKYS